MFGKLFICELRKQHFKISWHTELRLLQLEIVCLKGEFVQMEMRKKNRLKDQENNLCLLEKNKRPLFPSKSRCIFIPLRCSLWRKLVFICIMVFKVLFPLIMVKHKKNTVVKMKMSSKKNAEIRSLCFLWRCRSWWHRGYTLCIAKGL